MSKTEIRRQIETLENQTPRTPEQFQIREQQISQLLHQLTNPKETHCLKCLQTPLRQRTGCLGPNCPNWY